MNHFIMNSQDVAKFWGFFFFTLNLFLSSVISSLHYPQSPLTTCWYSGIYWWWTIYQSFTLSSCVTSAHFFHSTWREVQVPFPDVLQSCVRKQSLQFRVKQIWDVGIEKVDLHVKDWERRTSALLVLRSVMWFSLEPKETVFFFFLLLPSV